MMRIVPGRTLATIRQPVGRGIAILLVLCVATAVAFDQNHRISSLSLQGGSDSFATNNSFGGAFTATARNQLQTSMDASIADGSLSVIFAFSGLGDLTGVNATSFSLGAASGSPIIPPGNPTPYSGTTDLDWWYLLDPEQVDPAGIPSEQMPGSITSGVLTAGPGRVQFPNPFFGTSGVFLLSSTFVKANVGSSSAPLRSTNGFPPGHREPLDPSLQTFTTLGSGQMRGNISAVSLANTPVPEALITSPTACNQSYTAANTFLDLLVGGCTVFIVQMVRTTQPDQFDPAAPVLGAGPPYTFTRAGTHVTGARDRLGGSVDLQGALNASAYSTYFTFTTRRVIAYTEPSSAPRITEVTTLQNGAFRFTFTNAPRASFSVLASGDVASTNWTVIGSPAQPAPGRYELIDPYPTNASQRFFACARRDTCLYRCDFL